MPLNPALLSLFSLPYPATPADAALRIATSYDIYAKLAVAGVAFPVFTGLEKELLTQTLLPALAVPSPVPTVFVNALIAGLTAYWMTPPVSFVGPGAVGVVTVAPFAAAAPALTAAFVPGTLTEVCNAQVAAAIDLATRTVLVALVIAPAPPVPTPLL